MREKKVRIRFQFVGSVQAVGFRWTTNNLARSAGATGWVRNEDDGSVMAEIQGTPAQVEEVIDGLERRYNDGSWSDGFQLGRREYIPVVRGETSFHTRFS